MAFENVIGNEEVKDTLNKIIKTNKLSHSYMFIGPAGIGKTLFAKEFAKMILCENSNFKPCCVCKSCIELSNNNNPDLIEIEPNQGIIKIEQIRNVQSKVLEKPIISSKKVYIIKDTDCMTKESQNCLLKTLEEPPNFITIIMTCSNESMLLNTIRSRCIKVNFQKIEDKILKKYLENKYNFNIDEDILRACEGSIEKAIRVKENKEQYEEILKIFSNIENYNLLDVLNKIDFIYKNKDNIYDILDYINIVLSNKLVQDPKYIRYIEAVEQTKKNLKANSNYDMSIDNMIFKIWEE